ncbi:helix-turn-helix transcriptional regulator [Flavitalea sp. BT771]|uniref:AraC family transcriptional regulator n=1 Tax=Flavitalea sp. BT771 TaxID=3063329 RepID=UPI0026E2DE01|nr:helix-turn-helix transcriptional regulator [Flavitalea sp. BT771]MDO6432311.1 helix-turn-helix transcriptional regulator [Flavitalea sp. BT771]MDV6221221.1 helix-turn-helix transcriptional regulator [Flavitalea sp. BT771]
MGVAAKDIIPFHRLGETTDQGYQIDKVSAANDEAMDAILLGTHRDDHYIFLLQETGTCKCMVDFNHFIMEGNSIFFILPGQVHRYVEASGTTSGWFLALDAGLIPDMFRAVLEDPLPMRRPLPLCAEELETLSQCLQLLFDVSRKEPASPYYKQAAYGLVSSFTAMIAALYSVQPDAGGGPPPRPVMITQAFRRLLLHQFKVCKSPMEYAAALNLSLSYLNEAVKATTGLSVSNMIHYEVMLEAKRLLYHSSCSVKEIAHELGYEDHTYFSRLFKKTVGVTPGEFRRHYRE